MKRWTLFDINSLSMFQKFRECYVFDYKCCKKCKITVICKRTACHQKNFPTNYYECLVQVIKELKIFIIYWLKMLLLLFLAICLYQGIPDEPDGYYISVADDSGTLRLMRLPKHLWQSTEQAVRNYWKNLDKLVLNNKFVKIS